MALKTLRIDSEVHLANVTVMLLIFGESLGSALWDLEDTEWKLLRWLQLQCYPPTGLT